MTYREFMRQLAAQYLCARLIEAGGNVSQAARKAGLCRSRLYQLCARLGVDTSKAPKARSSLPSDVRVHL